MSEDRGEHTAEQRGELLRVLAVLFGVGALLLLVAVLLPFWPDANRAVLFAVVGVGEVGALVLLLLSRLAPSPWLAFVAVTVGTVLVSVAAHAMGADGSPAAGSYYIFATAYTFYFFPRAWALTELAVVGAAYAVVLWLLDPPAPAAQWVLTMGAAGVAGWVIAGLAKDRLATEQRLTDELRQVDASRTAFLRAVSHDVRTPLVSIAGFAEILGQQAAESDPETAKIARRIETNAHRVRRMLDDLLTLDRLRANEVALDRRPTDLAELVGRVVADDFADEERVVLRAPSAAEAEVDATYVQHAVHNLVANALKYSPADAPVEVSVASNGPRVHVDVEDRGPGIPDDEKEAVFEAFTRGSQIGEQAGSGIGLSVVRQFARLHDGEVTVENRDGGGSCFHLVLPQRSAGTTGPGTDRAPRNV